MLLDISDRFSYMNLFKIIPVVALLLGWAAAIQWVDRDTDVVKTKREQWNVIVISGGLVGYFALFVPPWHGPLFLVGIGFWLLLAGGAIVAYVVHRNGRVIPSARVLTIDHFKRSVLGSGKKKAIKNKGQRVRIEDHKGNYVERPDEPELVYEYDAAQDFLHDVLWRRALDVDILAGKEVYRVVYRIDGVPTERPGGIPIEDGERLFRFLKRNAGLNIEEIRRPQTGKMKMGLLSATDTEVTEVHSSGTTAGERLRLHVAATANVMRIHELGFMPARLDKVRQILNQPTGLLLLSATPQNGLTTTQYAVLRSHDAYIQNIHTLERKRLVELDNMTQQIYDGANPEINYARMLQSVLRREPDVVMVSECQDRETAQVASRAAADDRKIYLGIIAKDSFDALTKYLSFVDDNSLAASALVGVVNQRLMRILCEECRQAFNPDAATLKKLNLPADKIDMFYRPPTEPVLDKKGNEIICQNCQGTGYVGRVGVFELMIVDDAVRKLIAEGASVNSIKKQCRKNRMYYLQEEALLKVIDGTTSMNEVLRGLRDGGK